MFTLGDVLRKLRTSRGWSLDDMQAHSGVNRQSISEIERGVVDARKSTLDRMAAAFGYTSIAALESDQKGPDLHRHSGATTLGLPQEVPNVLSPAEVAALRQRTQELERYVAALEAELAELSGLLDRVAVVTRRAKALRQD